MTTPLITSSVWMYKTVLIIGNNTILNELCNSTDLPITRVNNINDISSNVEEDPIVVVDNIINGEYHPWSFMSNRFRNGRYLGQSTVVVVKNISDVPPVLIHNTEVFMFSSVANETIVTLYNMLRPPVSLDIWRGQILDLDDSEFLVFNRYTKEITVVCDKN